MIDYFIVVRTLHYITAHYCFSNTLCDADKLVVSYLTYIGGVISVIARYRDPLYERVAGLLYSILSMTAVIAFLVLMWCYLSIFLSAVEIEPAFQRIKSRAQCESLLKLVCTVELFFFL